MIHTFWRQEIKKHIETKERKKTTVKIVYGEVEYERRIYQVTRGGWVIRVRISFG